MKTSKLRFSRDILSWLIVDAIIVAGAYGFALLLRFDFNVPQQSWQSYLSEAAPTISVYWLANRFLGIYHTLWSYAASRDAIRLAQAVMVSTALLFVANLTLMENRYIPLSVILIGGTFAFLGMSAGRIWPKLWETGMPGRTGTGAIRLLIVGAGSTGQLVAREFLQNRAWNYLPVLFVDDNPRKQGSRIHGIPVLGTRGDIPALVREHEIGLVALAMPTAEAQVLRDLVSMCQLLKVPVRTVPGLPEIVSGKANVTQLREVTLEDLLSRDPISIDYAECAEYIQGKVVLITGAAGSIGSELARQLLTFGPASLHLLDNNETGLHDLSLELLASSPGTDIRNCIADVANPDKIRRVFSRVKPQLVFHAAAYKHVPLMEDHADEAFRVNVMGTVNVCQAADEQGVERVLFVSTDKAVNPVSVMGASKRIGELVVRAMAQQSRTVFCAVRFGNVIGSRGSVVPLFWKQIERGGPVSVTHPDMSRYFLTVPEAVTLLIQTAAFAGQGQIFMLDMGEEIRIVELAERMIRMRVFDPGKDIEIVFTGLRPGERLREELVAADEHTLPTRHPKVLLTTGDSPLAGETIFAGIQDLEGVLKAPPDDFAARLSVLARADHRETGKNGVHIPSGVERTKGAE